MERIIMSNLPQISPAQLELLLKMAGKQLHIDPQELRRQLESGDLRAVSTGLSGQAGQQLDRLLSDQVVVATEAGVLAQGFPAVAQAA